jgi:hypothetical protein
VAEPAKSTPNGRGKGEDSRKTGENSAFGLGENKFYTGM